MGIYLDNAATTKPSREVINEVVKGMEQYYGNPSSAHSLGVNSDKKLDECRGLLAKTINCSSSEIIFTSGGSEGNNLILNGLLKENTHLITTTFEHPSVKNTIEVLSKRGISVTYLSLGRDGRIDLEELKESIRKDTVLISIMYVRNEIGVIQEIEQIGEIIKKKSSRAKFHVDAVQGYGKLFIDVKKMNIDALTASAHKFHGPKGVGLCYLSKNINLSPYINGGSQEKGLRAGTQNLPGVMGLTIAALEADRNRNINFTNVLEIKKYMIDKLMDIKDIRINSPINDYYSPYILNVSFLGVRGEVLLHVLEAEQIYVSTGSACTSKSKAGVIGSHVLESIKLNSKEIESAVRFSFSEETTKEEVDRTIEAISSNLKFLRRIRR